MIPNLVVITRGNFEQFQAHMVIGKKNGIIKEEIAEITTSSVFYVG